MNNLKLVTYCGLYCGLCSQRNRIPQQARTLLNSLHQNGWDTWGQQEPHFKEFWGFLNRLVRSESHCTCRGGKCGPPFCGIKKCIEGKGIEVCPFCNEYPCERILSIAKGYPTMLADAQRMKEKGIEIWIQEQGERRKTGFAYVDVRYYPYSVPDK